jgi:thymidylate synthase (FAD)
MRVTVIAHTTFNAQMAESLTGGVWSAESDYDDASALTEYAGRACYQSWNRPNPETATNGGYIGNIIDQQHFSVMEHGTVTFNVDGVSRSLTHELVRHRHLSYSQLSQRYVKVDAAAPIVLPPLYRDDLESTAILQKAWDHAVREYDQLVAVWTPRLLQAGYDMHRARKKARQAARSVLPNCAPTSIIVSGNHRAWREMLAKRGSEHADDEIRQMAIAMYYMLIELEPNLYQDFRVTTINGEEVLIHG